MFRQVGVASEPRSGLPPTKMATLVPPITVFSEEPPLSGALASY